MSQSNEHDFYARYLNPAAGGDERGDSEPVEDQRPDRSGEGDGGRTGGGAHAAPERDLNDSDRDQNGHHAADSDDDYPLLTSLPGQQYRPRTSRRTNRRRWISTATASTRRRIGGNRPTRTGDTRRRIGGNRRIRSRPPRADKSRRRPRRGPTGNASTRRWIGGASNRHGSTRPTRPSTIRRWTGRGTNRRRCTRPGKRRPTPGHPRAVTALPISTILPVDTATALRAAGRRRRWGRCGRRCARPIWCARTSRSRRSGGARSCTS